MKFRVVKVGGSLFQFEPLVSTLRNWLRAHGDMANVLVAGGGPCAEWIRQLDATFGVGQAEAHWLAVRSLELTAHALAVLFPEAELLERLGELHQRLEDDRAGTYVFNPVHFLLRYEPHMPGARLPLSWATTSDAIAARLAGVGGADELVLLKSCPPPPAAGLQQLASLGYVDEALAGVAGELSVRCVDLPGWSAVI